MRHKPGDIIIIGALKAPGFNYEEVVGKRAKILSYEGGWAPYYRVKVEGRRRYGPDDYWCIQVEDCLTLYIEENTEAIGMLKEGDPYV